LSTRNTKAEALGVLISFWISEESPELLEMPFNLFVAEANEKDLELLPAPDFPVEHCNVSDPDPFDKVLRLDALDELPQLEVEKINVLAPQHDKIGEQKPHMSWNER
jgi:hypothetical protein